MPDARRRDLLYLRSHWRLPSHRNPRTLTEKINWRIVYDRREEIAFACDKLATKEFAEGCGLVRVPRTYWYGTDLTELLHVDLPSQWALKPNNASGLVLPGSGKVTPEALASLLSTTDGWYPPATIAELCEWAYAKARPVLFVEEWIGDGIPIDYKLFVFDGEPTLIQVDAGRFSSHEMSFYTVDWRFLPAHSRFPRGAPIERPPHLDRMLEAARYLARDLDFMRVDLYDVSGEVWFGELSPYPSSGLMKISPARFDRAWGKLWTLPTLEKAKG